MTQTATKQTLYDTDLNLWLETLISQLRAGDLQNVDLENLIEELEGLGGRDRRELKNRLTVLVEHNFTQRFDDAFKDALVEVMDEYETKGYQFPNTWQFNRDIDSILKQEFWN
jgi:hypothetical protein